MYFELVDDAAMDANWPDWVRVVAVSELGDSAVHISRFLRGPDGSTSALESVTVQRSVLRLVAQHLVQTVNAWEWNEEGFLADEAGVYDDAIPAVLGLWSPPQPDYEDDDEPYHAPPEITEADIPF